MMKQALGWLSSKVAHGQSIKCMLPFHPFIHRIANDLPGKLIHDNGQIQPAFKRPG
jgi:hypothetical protein